MLPEDEVIDVGDIDWTEHTKSWSQLGLWLVWADLRGFSIMVEVLVVSNPSKRQVFEVKVVEGIGLDEGVEKLGMGREASWELIIEELYLSFE